MKERTSELIPEYSDLLPENDQLEPGKLYISWGFKTSKHLCPCGCNGVVVAPIDESTRWGWDLRDYFKEGKWEASLYPSLLNTWCGTHYYIRANKVEWCH